MSFKVKGRCYLLTACFIFSYTFIAFRVCGQDGLLESELPSGSWNEGTVALNDGTQLKGLVRYNDKNGVLSFEKGGDSRSFLSRNVSHFEFYDAVIRQMRYFYTLPYEDPRDNVERMLFFELVKDMKSFVMLSKTDPIEVEKREVSVPTLMSEGSAAFAPGSSLGTITAVEQTETIYLMNEAGVTKPYFKIVEKESDASLVKGVKTKNKMIDEKLLQQYTGAWYEQLKAYAREHELRFNRKSDLIKILDYYESLVN